MAEPVSAEVLQALSHPLRLAILVALETRAQSPAELAATLDADERALGAHLATLHTARLIAAERGLLHTTTTGWSAIAAHLRRLQDADQAP